MILPLSITIPFIVLTDDGAVIAPVISRVPFIDTFPFVRDIKFESPTIPILDPLSERRTLPIKPDPLTSKSYPGFVVPIPSLEFAISQNSSFEPDCWYVSV